MQSVTTHRRNAAAKSLCLSPQTTSQSEKLPNVSACHQDNMTAFTNASAKAGSRWRVCQSVSLSNCFSADVLFSSSHSPLMFLNCPGGFIDLRLIKQLRQTRQIDDDSDMILQGTLLQCSPPQINHNATACQNARTHFPTVRPSFLNSSFFFEFATSLQPAHKVQMPGET
ncbi:Hypothetical predicted protein [Podarcis lilfordi]|uniref:Uncharacterized protein n=1 Tax=Podarcis lilfordi TaxID=74358 RepID=A0AA35KXF7_9SAUR|nr:Hypothetical predicted protein [Podarcis lilfordi]